MGADTVQLKDGQRRALSGCIGDVILKFYDNNPPSWAEISGSDDLAELRPLVIKQLRDKRCNEIADTIESADDAEVFLKQAIQQRFKSLRERLLRENRRRQLLEAERKASLPPTPNEEESTDQTGTSESTKAQH
ncbi:MAG: hypothetical protein Q9213_006952 [Squamulea squamosa]